MQAKELQIREQELTLKKRQYETKVSSSQSSSPFYAPDSEQAACSRSSPSSAAAWPSSVNGFSINAVHAYDDVGFSPGLVGCDDDSLRTGIPPLVLNSADYA